MKRTSLSAIFGVAVWVSCVGFAAPAGAIPLTIGDTNQLGYIDPGAPASGADEANYINFMTDLASGGSGFVDPGGSQENEISRTTNLLCGFNGACPEATTVGSIGDSSNNPDTSIDLGDGWTYLLAKYDGPNFGSVVWYVAGLTDVTIPSTTGKYGLSHWTLFNGTPGDVTDDPADVTDDPADVTVAEPTTLLLLGSGLVAASARLRRRRNS